MASSIARDAIRNPDEKKARILEAALEVCRQKGVDAARMEDVAALAHVSKGTLYRFFERKEDLFLATLLESYERSMRLVGPAMEAADGPLEELKVLLDKLTDVFAIKGPEMAVHYQAWGLIARHPPYQERLYGYLRHFFAEHRRTGEEMIRRGQEAGVFPFGKDDGPAPGPGAIEKGLDEAHDPAAERSSMGT